MTKKTIIIIGGGIVGSTTAYYLAKAGHQVTLIDEGTGQATKAAAGIICPWLSQRRNQDWYRLTSQGAAFYQKLMKDLADDGVTQLPYQQRGTLVFKNKPQLLDKLARIAQERQQSSPEIGNITVHTQDLTKLIPPLHTVQGAVLTSGGGRVDGGQLITQLRQIFAQYGGRFYQGQARLLDRATVELDGQTYRADCIVLASGAWLPELLEPLGYQVDIRPQKGQLLEVMTKHDTSQWPGCLLHGEIDILPFEEGRLVIGATHENDQGYNLDVDPDKIAQMQATASQFIPDLAQLPISRVRVGTRAYTSDFLPFYGQLSDTPSLYAISGLGSSGLTSGPFIAWQIAEQICGRGTDFDATAFSPAKYILGK